MKPNNISKQRILGEARGLQKEKLSYLQAGPIQDDLYTWHFTFQGPEGTEFHEGIYHGQILLPYEYPFKPPDIVFMNKNGRFEVDTKICLTITQYHPQEWNPAWTVRTMLEAVISLFAENVQGVGSVTSSPQVRQYLAKKSHTYTCDKCGPIEKILSPRLPRNAKIQQQRTLEDLNRKASSASIQISQVPDILKKTESSAVNPKQIKRELYKKKSAMNEIYQKQEKKRYYNQIEQKNQAVQKIRDQQESESQKGGGVTIIIDRNPQIARYSVLKNLSSISNSILTQQNKMELYSNKFMLQFIGVD